MSLSCTFTYNSLPLLSVLQSFVQGTAGTLLPVYHWRPIWQSCMRKVIPISIHWAWDCHLGPRALTEYERHGQLISSPPGAAVDSMSRAQVTLGEIRLVSLWTPSYQPPQINPKDFSRVPRILPVLQSLAFEFWPKYTDDRSWNFPKRAYSRCLELFLLTDRLVGFVLRCCRKSDFPNGCERSAGFAVGTYVRLY